MSGPSASSDLTVTVAVASPPAPAEQRLLLVLVHVQIYLQVDLQGNVCLPSWQGQLDMSHRQPPWAKLR